MGSDGGAHGVPFILVEQQKLRFPLTPFDTSGQASIPQGERKISAFVLSEISPALAWQFMVSQPTGRSCSLRGIEARTQHFNLNKFKYHDHLSILNRQTGIGIPACRTDVA
jgi:hypothetical protein